MASAGFRGEPAARRSASGLLLFRRLLLASWNWPKGSSLSLGGVSLVRLYPGNSFGLRGHGGCTASGTESTLRAESERKGEDKVS